MLITIGGFVYWFGCSLPLYIYIFSHFSLLVSVYVYASLCDFVYIGLLLPFFLGSCISVFLFLFFWGGFLFCFVLFSFFLFF